MKDNEIIDFILGGTHSRNCSYNNAIGDEGDFCTCKYLERRNYLCKLLDERRKQVDNIVTAKALMQKQLNDVTAREWMMIKTIDEMRDFIKNTEDLSVE